MKIWVIADCRLTESEVLKRIQHDDLARYESLPPAQRDVRQTEKIWEMRITARLAEREARKA